MSASTAPVEGHVTTAPAASSPGWRATVIVLVGLLSVGIGAALGSYLLNGRSAGLGSAASYVPADAAMYVELRLTPSADQDAALRDVLGRFPPIDGLDLSLPLSETLPTLAAEWYGVAAEGSLSWSADVAPWFDGRIGLAVGGGADAGTGNDPLGAPGAPGGLVLLGVTDRAAAAGAIERILAEVAPGATFTDADHAGVTIRESPTGSGAYALTDDQLLLALDADEIREALDAHASGETLAASGDLSGYAARLPADWLAFATYDLHALLSESAAMGAGLADMATAFEALYAHQPKRMAYSLSATAEGLAFDAFSDLPTGPFTVVNADRGLAREVPDDAFVFVDGGNLGPAMSATIEAFEASVSSAPEVAEQIATVEAALGSELSELVDWIGDGAFAIGSDDGELYAGMVLVPSDVAEAERTLGQLATFARLAAADPTTGIGVAEASVETAAGPVTVTTIVWQPAEGTAPPAHEPLPFTGLVIEYAVTDDRAIVGIGGSFVRRALALDPAGALAADPRYRDSVASLGGTPNAGTMWVDLTGLREAAEGLIPLDAQTAYQADVLPWLEPLDRFVAVTRVDGTTLESHAVLFIE